MGTLLAHGVNTKGPRRYTSRGKSRIIDTYCKQEQISAVVSFPNVWGKKEKRRKKNFLGFEQRPHVGSGKVTSISGLCWQFSFLGPGTSNTIPSTANARSKCPLNQCFLDNRKYLICIYELFDFFLHTCMIQSAPISPIGRYSVHCPLFQDSRTRST